LLAIALAVARKDLRDIFKNRAILLSVLAPVILSVVFVRIAEHASNRPVRVALVSAQATTLQERLRSVEALKVTPHASHDEAGHAVEIGETDLALVLPASFDEAVAARETPLITVIVRKDGGPMVAAGLAALVEALRGHAGQDPPVQVDLVTLGVDEKVVQRGRLVSAWVLFALLIGFTVVASSLIEERERGTLAAILAMHADARPVLAGKAIIGFVVSAGASAAIVAGNGLATSVGMESATVLLGGVAFVVALGLWMGTLFPNMASANAGLSAAFMVLFVPVYLADLGSGWGGAWIAWLPSHTLMDGLRRALQGDLPLAAAWSSTGLLTAWALAFAVLAAMGLARVGEARA